MPRKTGTQKRKAKQTSGQEGQDPVEEYFRKLRRPGDAEFIRGADSVKEKVDNVGTLFRVTVNTIREEADEEFGELVDNAIAYFDLAINLY